MPAFGRDEMLDRDQVQKRGSLRLLADQSRLLDAGERRPDRGRAGGLPDDLRACHGENAKGNRDVGAPNLTDAHWIYGGDLDTIIDSVHGGRQGHMPTWDERLTPAEIRMLALYVHDFGNAAAMTARLQNIKTQNVARLGARPGRSSPGRRRQRTPRLRGGSIAAGLRRAH